ncbi:MAG: DUF3471 domain-containing protein, partial [Longimicrobiales bacterium]
TASATPAVTPPSLPLERYAGTYRHGAYGRLLVSHRAGQLRAQFEARPAYTLVHSDFETFRTPDAPSGDGLTITFDPDGAGRIVAARLFGASFERLREQADR